MFTDWVGKVEQSAPLLWVSQPERPRGGGNQEAEDGVTVGDGGRASETVPLMLALVTTEMYLARIECHLTESPTHRRSDVEDALWWRGMRLNLEDDLRRMLVKDPCVFDDLVSFLLCATRAWAQKSRQEPKIIVHDITQAVMEEQALGGFGCST